MMDSHADSRWTLDCSQSKIGLQVVILVVDHDKRPDIDAERGFPGGVPAAYNDYIRLMAQCWATDAQSRPTYETIIGQMRYIPPPSFPFLFFTIKELQFPQISRDVMTLRLD